MLRVGRPTAQVVGALAYTMSPRVLSTIGGLSSEALPVLLAPAILLPVVLATQGRVGPRRAAALSGPRGALLRGRERHGHDPGRACRPACGC